MSVTSVDRERMTFRLCPCPPDSFRIPCYVAVLPKKRRVISGAIKDTKHDDAVTDGAKHHDPSFARKRAITANDMKAKRIPRARQSNAKEKGRSVLPEIPETGR